jgi:prepilin-type N-terminal cleavage/methylation domain-containing protein
MNTISNWEEVPIFDSEEAEALFWSETRPDARLMESAVSGSTESSESVAISLRIDPRMLARIKRLARSRFLNYQSMIKQWLSERIEQESSPDTSMKNQNRNRQAGGFTLVELLVVISIIAVLSALIASGARLVIQKNKIHRVQAELGQIKNAIENYKSRKGFYPPDNPGSPQTNALYFELVGTVNANGAGVYVTLDDRAMVTNTVTQPDLKTYCGVDGVANSTTETNRNSEGFAVENFAKSLRNAEIEKEGHGITLLDVPVDSPDGTDFNPWHYVSTGPTNNPDSYDLWAEIMIGRQTNIICNWSDHPIVK